MPSKYAKSRRATRPRPTVPQRLRILVVAEGRVTERRYFRAMGRVYRAAVEVEVDRKTGVPKTLVEVAVERMKESRRQARREKDDSYLYDDIWCVFDVDDHPNLAEALDQASANGIQVAASNPCFELWAFLHFKKQSAWIHRDPLRRKLCEQLPNYAKELPFERLERSYPDALRRARELEREAGTEGETYRNPSTYVHHLTERIRHGNASG